MSSGILVLFTGIRYLDLIVGAGIGLYVIREAIEIISDRASRSGKRRRERTRMASAAPLVEKPIGGRALYLARDVTA